MLSVVGIDPDLRGGIAHVEMREAGPSIYSLARIHVTTPRPPLNKPSVFDTSLIMKALFEARQKGAVRVFVEVPGFLPGEQKGLIRQHQNVGRLMGICELVFGDTAVQSVPPKVWKSSLGLGSDKAQSRAKASEMFPSHAAMFDMVKNTGLAEATLIGVWGATQVS